MDRLKEYKETVKMEKTRPILVKQPEKSPGVRKGKGKPKKKARPTESADFSRARLEVL
ncbi:hypothetical protein ADU37_CDS01140 [Thermococcus sp. 2319x1]|nr:hypothetical protein ADU37_CDS01140 [Thermococcus sp. 2319x1]